MVFVIRVKTNAGNFRVGGLDPYNATSADVVAAFPTTAPDAFRSCRVDSMHITTPLCTDPRCTVPLDANRPLAYCKVAFRHPQPPPGLGCNTRKYNAAITASSTRIAPPSARAVERGSTAVATSGAGDASRRPKSPLDLEARPKIGIHQQTIRPRNALLTACPLLRRGERGPTQRGRRRREGEDCVGIDPTPEAAAAAATTEAAAAAAATSDLFIVDHGDGAQWRENRRNRSNDN
jgi:hypothetical protein